MSAPGTDQSLSSISSSGQVDGLGRRVLAFDRETGAILERLYLRPEVAAFESAIRERIDQLASLDDERFARPGSIERDPNTGELTVLSEFVAGSRLSDLLETAEEGALVPGVDVALGFLLEALSAIAGFHAATGFAHGLIAPPRMVLTPAGQIVLLDPALGGVVERLGMSRARLWTQLEIAARPGRGPVQLDASADVAQAALSALMLVIGRRLREHEYPDALPSLVSEVVEVAQIRGSSLFASTLQRLLERALALDGTGPAASADDLSNEIRLLLRREIGVEVCRQALIDFTEQMDAAFSTTRGEADGEYLQPAVLDAGAGAADPDLDLDRLTLEALDTLEVLDVEDPDSLDAGSEEEEDAGDEAFEDVPLDPEFVDEADLPPPPAREPEPEPTYFEDEPLADPEPPAGTPSAVTTAEDEIASSAEPKEIADPWSFDPAAADRVLETGDEEARRFDEPAAIEPPPLEPSEAVSGEPLSASFDDAASASPGPAPALADPSLATDASPPAAASPDPAASGTPDPDPLPALSAPEAEAPSEFAPTPVDEPAPATGEEPVPASPRRKKRQHKSARARKDKLRSAADAKPPAKAPETRSQGGWLVNPERAAAFVPPVPELAAPQPPPVVGHSAPVPAASHAAVQAPAPVAVPAVAPPPPPAPIPMPVYGAPAVPAPAPAPPPPPPPAPPRTLKPIAPAGAPLRLKEQPPSGYARKRPSETFASGYVQRAPLAEPDPPRRFPWKLALVLLVLVAAAIVIGRAYLPAPEVADDEGAAVGAGAAAPQEPAVVVMPKVETGHISIETQPAGARVLLDGKPVGESPLKLADVPVGRHTLTFASSSGQVSRTVQVEPGRTAAVDVSIFSGWVAVYAPVVLDVAVNGRSIGTTERERLMLAPGRHELTLTNTELGYKTVQTVQVEPGEVRGVRLDPRGPVSFNAIPWAEVWLAGKKLGETPLANVHVPIGIQEFVFKHPEYGERKVTVTIRATGTEAVSVDFTGLEPGPESR